MGFSMKEISERLGHESIKTTLDTYGHLYPDKDVKLAEALNRLRRPGSKKNNNDNNDNEAYEQHMRNIWKVS